MQDQRRAAVCIKAAELLVAVTVCVDPTIRLSIMAVEVLADVTLLETAIEVRYMRLQRISQYTSR